MIICYLPPMKGTRKLLWWFVDTNRISSWNFSVPFLAARFFQPCIQALHGSWRSKLVKKWQISRHLGKVSKILKAGMLVDYFLQTGKLCRGNLYDHIYWYVIIHFHSIQFLIVQHMFEYLYIYIPVKGSLSIDIHINSLNPTDLCLSSSTVHMQCLNFYHGISWQSVASKAPHQKSLQQR